MEQEEKEGKKRWKEERKAEEKPPKYGGREDVTYCNPEFEAGWAAGNRITVQSKEYAVLH